MCWTRTRRNYATVFVLAGRALAPKDGTMYQVRGLHYLPLEVRLPPLQLDVAMGVMRCQGDGRSRIRPVSAYMSESDGHLASGACRDIGCRAQGLLVQQRDGYVSRQLCLVCVASRIHAVFLVLLPTKPTSTDCSTSPSSPVRVSLYTLRPRHYPAAQSTHLRSAICCNFIQKYDGHLTTQETRHTSCISGHGGSKARSSRGGAGAVPASGRELVNTHNRPLAHPEERLGQQESTAED
jgi:hypothetical protein